MQPLYDQLRVLRREARSVDGPFRPRVRVLRAASRKRSVAGHGCRLSGRRHWPRRQADPHTPAIRRVVAALEEDGEEARLVGGCVRDALAGRPIKDIDLATPLRPEAVIERLERAGIRVVPTGLSHGTVTAIVGPRKDAVEITTLRVDRETDGRRAIVDFTDDWTADAARRDFTINAISLSSDGRIHDPFGGAADLAQGRVRFVGEASQRIAEDYLRLLRFFRFHAYYGRGAMDPEALEGVFRQVPAIHRFPANMAKRTQAVSQYIVDEYGGDASAIWSDAKTADELLARLKALPGFGDYKARLTLGVLAKQYGVKPRGFTKYLPDWPSIVDIKNPEDLAELTVRKKAWKAAKQ